MSKQLEQQQNHRNGDHLEVYQWGREGESLKSNKRKGECYLADLLKETLQARRGWREVFKVMKGKDLHPRLLYPAKLSFRMMEGKIKCFSDKVKLKKFIITKPLLYEMLKGLT